MELDGRRILVNPDLNKPTDAAAADQLVIRDKDGTDHQVRLYAGMSPDKLRADVEGLKLGDIKEMWFDCDVDDSDKIKSLLCEAFPSMKVSDDRSQAPAANRRLPGRVYFQFSGDYFRALAKIAFHYYLVHNSRGLKGSEPAFANIRRFIRHGGDEKPFFQSGRANIFHPFGETPDGKVICPSNWCHLLAAVENRRTVVVYMLLYAGPGSVPAPIHVELGTLDTRIVLPQAVWGHIFECEPDRTGRYAGRVRPCSFTRLDGKDE